MKSLIKVGNLLLNSSMHQLFADMCGTYDLKYRRVPNWFIARKAYLSLLMFLPVNKITRPLKLKIEEFELEDDSDSESESESEDNK